MTRTTPTFIAAALGLALAGSALAESHMDQATAAAIGARQAHMTLYGHNLGVLGGMARGNMDYDADMASAAAANLHALAMIDQQGYWPEGTSTEELPDETRALPAIWEDMDDFMGHLEQLREASASLEEVAGDGLEALQGAMGGVGGACGGCHEDFRQSN